MPINVSCPACRSEYRLPESMAGKRGKCRKCGQALQIPSLDGNLPASAVTTGNPFSFDPSAAGSSAPPAPVPPPAFSFSQPDPAADAPGVAHGARSRKGPNLYTLVALLLGIGAMPLVIAVPMNPVVAVGLTVLGILFAVIGLIVSLMRRGAGMTLALVGMAVCASSLFVAYSDAGGKEGILQTIRRLGTPKENVPDLPSTRSRDDNRTP